jgi:hypothetical protein
MSSVTSDANVAAAATAANVVPDVDAAAAAANVVPDVAANVVPDVAANVAADVPDVDANVAAADAAVAAVAPGSDASVPDQITVALVDEIVKDNDRKTVETGLQAFNTFNATSNFCKTVVSNIQDNISQSESIRLYCNPEIGLLSDFAPHYKMLISVNDANDAIEGLVTEVSNVFLDLVPTFHGLAATDPSAFMVDFKQISLVLRIGQVFQVPVFTRA